MEVGPSGGRAADGLLCPSCSLACGGIGGTGSPAAPPTEQAGAQAARRPTSAHGHAPPLCHSALLVQRLRVTSQTNRRRCPGPPQSKRVSLYWRLGSVRGPGEPPWASEGPGTFALPVTMQFWGSRTPALAPQVAAIVHILPRSQTRSWWGWESPAVEEVPPPSCYPPHHRWGAEAQGSSQAPAGGVTAQSLGLQGAARGSPARAVVANVDGVN